MNHSVTLIGGGGRFPFYDNLKAIGIFLVVLGHVTENESLHDFIYTFHMPLFFVISGMLYKRKEHYAIKQARTLLWPYLTFALLSFIYWATIEVRMRPVHEGTSIMEQFTNIFYPINMRQNAHLMNVVLWFLPALYVCSVCYHYIVLRIRNIKMQLITIAIMAVVLQFFDFWLPFCIPQALCALPFFALGHRINNKIKSMESTNIPKIAFCGIIIFFIILYLYHPGGYMNSNGYPMGYISYFVIACCSIIALCIIIPREKNCLLSFLGINSLAIMLIHEPLKRIVIKGYSLAISMDMDIVRESVLHSLLITVIVLLLCWPMIVFTKKHCGFLYRI